MADINALQAAVSRFGNVAGFGSVTPTGQADDQTLAAVKNALTWIRDHVSGEADTATGLIAAITDSSTMTQHADGLTTYLNGIADSNSVGGSNLDFAPQAPGITSLKQAWATVPTWAKVLGGAGIAVGLFFLGRSLTRRSGEMHGYQPGSY